MELDDLAGNRHVIPLLAEWHVQQWQHLYPEWNVEAAIGEFEAMTGDGTPHTIVAFDRGGRSLDDVVGSVSIIDDDELAGFEGVGPWLASLYVRPAFRGAGVGRRLVAAAVEFAREQGIDRLYLFNSDTAEFYGRLGWRTIARTDKNGHLVAVMTIHTSAQAPRHGFATDWCTSRWFRGAYSYLRPDGSPEDRDMLAEPIAPGLVLAGEATSRDFPGTTHGAWFSGQRVAERICATSPATAIVVGAGLAGIAAARTAQARGAEVTVLEATSRIGGRATSRRWLGGPGNVGAAWLHGTEHNPLFEVFTGHGTPQETGTFRQMTTFLAGHGELTGSDLARLERLHSEVETRIAAAARSAVAGDTVAGVLYPAIDAVAADDRSATVLRSWLRGTYENLYAAPPVDLSLRHHAEPFRLPGEDVMITVGLEDLVRELAGDVQITYESPVQAILRHGDRWRVCTLDRELVTEAVVVTVSIGVLHGEAIAFDPPLPQQLREALSRIGAGLVTKAFFAFDTAFWAPRRAFWIASDPPALFELWVDVSSVRGAPTLCAFAVGRGALAVEQMSEDELLETGWATLQSAGGLVP